MSLTRRFAMSRDVLGCLLAGALAASIVRADAPELVTALKHDRLFTALGVQLKTGGEARTLTGAGVTYVVEAPGVPGIHELSIAVRSSQDAAQQAGAAMRSPARSSVDRDPPTAEYADIGDARYVWGTRRSSELGLRIAFVRDNVTVVLSWGGPREQGRTLARQIDQLIQSDRQIAPRGTFAETPEILTTDLPSCLGRDAKVTARPQVRGLGGGAIRFAVIDEGQVRRLSSDGADGALCVSPPKRTVRPPTRTTSSWPRSSRST